MSNHVGLIRFTGVDGKAQQVSGYLDFDDSDIEDVREVKTMRDWQLDMSFTIHGPLAETFPPDVLDLLFGVPPEPTDPPFPDPEDDSRE